MQLLFSANSLCASIFNLNIQISYFTHFICRHASDDVITLKCVCISVERNMVRVAFVIIQAIRFYTSLKCLYLTHTTIKQASA